MPRPRLTPLIALRAFLTSDSGSVPERNAEALEFNLPGQWNSGGRFAKANTTGWLKTFNDERLSSLVEAGLKDNYDLNRRGSRRGSLRAARARRHRALAAFRRFRACRKSWRKSTYNPPTARTTTA